MTLYEVDLLSVRHRQVEARTDRRAALAAWVLANVHRDSERQPEGIGFDDVVSWLGHGFQAREVKPETQRPVAETTLTQAQVLTELYGGAQPSNGTGDGT